MSVECLFLGVSSLGFCMSRISLCNNLELSLPVTWQPGVAQREAGAWGAAWLSQLLTPGLLDVSWLPAAQSGELTGTAP